MSDGAQQLLTRLRPRLRQAWWNLKVWVPFLLNPTDRLRQVTYHARENREGFNWTVQLPDHCWKCDVQEGTWRREIELDVRGFEHAITLVAATAGCFLFFLLLVLWIGGYFTWMLLIASLLIGAGLLYAKSWAEVVTVTLSTCPQHADELPMPDMVTHENELHVFMPTERMAAAARAQLRTDRQGRDRTLPGAPRDIESDVEPPPDRGYRSPYGSTPPRSVDLPPIRLADDEEE